VNGITGSRAQPTGQSPPADAIVQLLASIIASQIKLPAEPHNEPGSMLTVTQTAALLGVSRMTIIRKANAGDLPCIVVTRGSRNTIRRFPRKFIEDLAAGLGSNHITRLCGTQEICDADQAAEP
jgi:predicted DNA-binding transcriptional regulator AlpA